MNTERRIQLIEITPNELANLISECVKTHIQELITATNKEQSKTESDLLTRKETADFFKVSLVTVHQWVNNGIIHPFKIGSKTYFKKSELITLFKNQSK
jgi:hypothetical protein